MLYDLVGLLTVSKIFTSGWITLLEKEIELAS